MMRKLPFAVLAALFAASCLVAPPAAPACGIAPGLGQHIEIAEEAALIVWDEAAKTEHFIRQAKFHGTSSDFGFLVPTPSQPELGESDDAAFAQLAEYTAPKIETRIVKMPRPKPAKQEDAARAGGFANAPMAGPRGVEVLDTGEFGGYEAVVLKFHRAANDDPIAGAKELADWLKKRNYEFGPHLAAWLKPYIANDWIMTAFRIAKRVPVSKAPGPAVSLSGIQDVQTKPVRMSFKTDRPLYPYREPEAPQAKNDATKQPGLESHRFLRVYVFAAERFTGTLGAGATPWVGKAAWSDKLNEGQAQQVEKTAKLPDGSLAKSAWLTEFEDDSAPRKGTDEVYFAASTDKAAIHRPTIYHDVIEYYDGPESGADTETPYLVKIAAVGGGVAFIGVLGGLLFLILRQR